MADGWNIEGGDCTIAGGALQLRAGAQLNAVPPARHGVAILPDTDALNRFFTGVERRAYRIAHVATGNGDDALDIVQDAMLKLAERYAGRPAQEWGALFQKILQSRIRDWYRRNTVRNRFRAFLRIHEEHGGDPLDTLASPQHTPEEALREQDSITALDAALRALPLRQQQAFVLRVWEGYDTAQTARTMGCSQGSVKTHFSRALASLRNRLGEHWQ